MAVTDPGPQGLRADVELRLPADSAYVSVLRTTTAGLAARLDFTIEDIEDLRIAVGETCAVLLPEADPGCDLVCRYRLAPGRLTLAASVEATAAQGPDPDSFAWQVLSTLADEVSFDVEPGRLTVTMTLRSSLEEPT